MSNLIKIAGLWKNTSKVNTTYLSGKIADAKILVFANNKKTAAHQPDYQLYIDYDTFKTETLDKFITDEYQKFLQWKNPNTTPAGDNKDDLPF